MESECSQLQQELQDSKDQNELLEFRILELEVSSFLNLYYLEVIFRGPSCGCFSKNNTLTDPICFLQIVSFFFNYRKDTDRKSLWKVADVKYIEVKDGKQV